MVLFPIHVILKKKSTILLEIFLKFFSTRINCGEKEEETKEKCLVKMLANFTENWILELQNIKNSITICISQIPI